jgi:hypothetical protein
VRRLAIKTKSPNLTIAYNNQNQTTSYLSIDQKNGLGHVYQELAFLAKLARIDVYPFELKFSLASCQRHEIHRINGSKEG